MNQPLSDSRLISLDTMRGYTIAAMILVNFPGSDLYIYAPLQHSQWNGLSFTDLIAPTFLFIVGVSIALAYSKKKDGPKRPLYRKIIIRSVKIFAVGMFLNLLPDFDFSELRYTGTLHRIAIVFLASAFLFLNSHWKQQAFLALFILVAYHMAMNMIPTPGYNRAMLDPGVNLAAWVDQQLLPGTMWQGNWDPEGILSTFPSIATCITGMLAGRMLLSSNSPNRVANWLMSLGFVGLATGYFWGLGFPVNENLWTSSFVMVTSGFASLLLGAVYFLVDILKRQKGTGPAVIMGANAIAVYVLADIWALVLYLLPIEGKTLNMHFVNWAITIGFDPPFASFCYALAFVIINYIPAYLLYKKKIFVKL
ncbi:acyltransferase family protein [Dyadobacter tibetensis]|uniref:acyltransferase family protein n=1 Tax=Dyadobacter tibetensis TaxID=1211851 RepID=UPI0004724D1E|nr:heparan-alpha-glucosaminide N-acetyltransferase domain-containing protein [Dyadobacter tibetensis]